MSNLSIFDKKNFARNLIVVGTSPIIINFLMTFQEDFKLKIIQNFYSALPVTSLIFLFFLVIGIALKEIFNFKTISFSISIIFSSFFIIDNVFLFITSKLEFRTLIYFFISILFVFILFKLEKPKNYYFFSSSILLAITINLLFNLELSSFAYTELFTSDEARLWYPSTKIIYEQNYFYALQSSSIEGYGLYSSHVKAFISVISTTHSEFIYNPSISNIFLLLFFLIIFEINIEKKIKVYLFLLFFSIVFTNNWVNYLFFNSLLGEGPAGFLFGAIIFEITRSNRSIPAYLVFFLSFNIYGKNFLTVVSMFLILYFFIKFKKIEYLFIGIFPAALSITNSYIFDVGYLWKYYFSTSNSQKSNDMWSPKNFVEIFKQFYVDKTLTIIFLLIIFLYLISKNKFGRLSSVYFLSETIFFVNIFVVFLVYIFLVEEFVAIQDSYRYLINTFFLLPVILSNFIINE